MRDNADLQDRTQQLEHLILQLQSETDTIGKITPKKSQKIFL